tara:strand:- start:2773 stop:3957 length:1185 start_codon:yes stop_codon:yes gene_type:complete
MINLVSDTIDRADINNLIEWLNQEPIPRLTKGHLTKELEDAWAKKIGTNYSVYVNSGSSALLLTLAALKYFEIENGPSSYNFLKNNKIVIPNLSWATDVSSPHLLGYDVSLVDCNLDDLSVDIESLERIFIQETPAALMLVSVLGFVPKMDVIIDLCNKYNVILLEDVCESMGSEYNNRKLGSFGLASCFSLYFGHHLSTIEGGFINTDNKDFYNLLLSMRSHGWDRDCDKDVQTLWRDKYNVDDFSSLYTFFYPGFNVRSTDLQAFIGLRQINKLDNYKIKRNTNYKLYKKYITNNKLNLEERTNDFISNFTYPVIAENRSSIVSELQKNNVEVRPLIAGAMHKNPFIKKYITREHNKSFPNCELVDTQGFYIPNHQDISEEDIKFIANIVNE